MLQFLSQWLARDSGPLSASLVQFAGHPAYGITQPRDDLERFAFLLAGSDGEQLFGPCPGSRPRRAYPGPCGPYPH